MNKDRDSLTDLMDVVTELAIIFAIIGAIFFVGREAYYALWAPEVRAEKAEARRAVF